MNQKNLPFVIAGAATFYVLGNLAVTLWNIRDIYKLQKFMCEQKVKNAEQSYDNILRNMHLHMTNCIEQSMTDKVFRMDQDIKNLTAQVNKLQSENSKEESKTEK